ncbi:Signal recognition particle SEC65 subunit [Cytospora mali]|uniref:Signal recognition particle SEC65 subunit n=1 Tax=Cytospora mali TaxID=578113 RepID=A0A194VS79_CYTMA|nr:Signal recognition particle SEC65 subunit [Valsa mali]
MSHPRIEEVEDSDIDMSDPSEGDIEDFVESDILRERSNPAEPFASKSFAIRRPPPSARAPGNGAAAAAHAAAAAKSHILTPSQIPMVSSGPPTAGHHHQQQQHTSSGIPTTADRKAYAAFQCLYPVYFDAARTRAEGRRVAKELAVANPLAREIVNACRDLRLQTVFEPDKMHPQDWANPGRVKVQLKGAAGKAGGGGGRAAGVKNKHQLYILIAQHLRNNPATDKSQALWERLPGVPAPDGNKPYPRPAVPRGWKVGEFVPYYSPAMTGGGVSENLFKDMMKEMQGGGDMAGLLGGAAGGGGGGGSGNASEDGGGKKGKKDKKGKGKA